MQFEEKPDYNYLRSLFRTMMTRFSYDYDGDFDWVIKKEGREDQLKALLIKENPVKPSMAITQTGNNEEYKEAPKAVKPPVALA